MTIHQDLLAIIFAYGRIVTVRKYATIARKYRYVAESYLYIISLSEPDNEVRFKQIIRRIIRFRTVDKNLIEILSFCLRNPRQKFNWTANWNEIESILVRIRGRWRLKLMQLLYQHPNFNPCEKDNEQTLGQSIVYSGGNLDVAKFILADRRVDPSYDSNVAIRKAAHFGYVEIVKLLLADKEKPISAEFCAEAFGKSRQRVDPTSYQNEAIQLAARYGHTEVVRLLLADERVNSMDIGGMAMGDAINGGHLGVIQLLLADKKFNPAKMTNFNLGRIFSGNPLDKIPNQLEIARLFLAEPWIKFNIASTYFLMECCDNVEMMKLLLADSRCDPAMEQNRVLRNAVEREYVEIVRLLLADGRANPADKRNDAICIASKKGNVGIVRLLLADKRVNPAEKRNLALRNALSSDNIAIIQLLLADERMIRYISGTKK